MTKACVILEAMAARGYKTGRGRLSRWESLRVGGAEDLLSLLERQLVPLGPKCLVTYSGSSLPRGLAKATDHHPAGDDGGCGGQGRPVHMLSSQQQQLPHDLCLEEGQ